MKLISYIKRHFPYRIVNVRQLNERNRINEKNLRKNEKNLKRHLQNRASETTADFIIENMRAVSIFNDKTALLSYAISKIGSKNGLMMEFGVYQGHTINHIARELPENTIYGFDSFEGLPETWRTGFKTGMFDCKGKMPDVEHNVSLVKGWFDSSIPLFLSSHIEEKVSFIHIDCDLYSSTKTIFDLLKDKIVNGTVIVFDEFFNYPSWQYGEYKAFREFTEANGIEFKYLGYTIDEQVAVIIC